MFIYILYKKCNNRYQSRLMKIDRKVGRMSVYYYTIGSIYDDEQRFPGLCAAHLFNQLNLKNDIVIRYPGAIINFNESKKVIDSFAGRDDVEYTSCEFKRYTAIMLYFKKAIDTNLDIVPLLYLDSLDTQYIALTNPDYAEILKKDWRISDRKLFKNDMVKFMYRSSQDRDLVLLFNDRYYDCQKVKEELKKWEQRIPEITGMQHMECKDEYNMFIEISLY